MKKIMVVFDFKQANLQQYDAVWNDLRATGNEHPQGLIMHTGAPTPNGGLMIVDVWESQQDFEAFGKTLLPFIQKQGLQAQPTILPVHYAYEKQTQKSVV